MLPHHIITAITVLTINLTDTLASPTLEITGAAVFTGSIEYGEVTFALDTIILSPSEQSSRLLDWLDRALADDRATITAYDFDEIVAGLEALTDSKWASSIRVLRGCGPQSVIDTVVRGEDHVARSFREACLKTEIPCSAPDTTDDFACWMTGRTASLHRRLEIDVIASWRLTMTHITQRSALGRHVSAAIEKQLAGWLSRAGSPAAAIHLESLARTAG